MAAALEADLPGGYLGAGVIPMSAGETESPVYRLIRRRPEAFSVWGRALSPRLPADNAPLA